MRTCGNSANFFQYPRERERQRLQEVIIFVIHGRKVIDVFLGLALCFGDETLDSFLFLNHMQQY